MPLPSRKKFKFQIPASDNELWAVGVVAVQWAQLETFMLGFVHAMTKKDSAERNLFDSTTAFKRRLEQWEVIVTQR